MTSEPLNAEPAAATAAGHPANAAKATPAKKTVAKKAASAKKTTATHITPAREVTDLLTGQHKPGAKVEVSAQGQALLVAIRLEQHRPSLFDANGLYVGPVSFNELLGKLLSDVSQPKVDTVRRYLSRAQAFTTVRQGRVTLLTWHGTKEARSILAELPVGTAVMDLGEQLNETEPVADGPTAGKPQMAVQQSAGQQPAPAQTAPSFGLHNPAADLLVRNTADEVYRLVGHDPALAYRVAELILTNRFAG